MSTFEGKLQEIDDISIDRFDGKNLQSKAFFLSHCHTDHMQGLRHNDFSKRLCDDKLYLYLSPISAEIIRKMFPYLGEHLKVLELHTPTVIFIDETKSLTVTPIPAGHCPGSVMFLFETANKNILYTGDYRINPNDLKKIKAFYDFTNTKKRIDALYLDTTFFLKEYQKFPRRKESLNAICEIINKWISKGDEIILNVSAKYGYEYLFMEISKEFNMKIHVGEEIFNFCSKVPELDQAVTKSEQTKIHSLYCDRFGKCCPDFEAKEIKISSFRWKSADLCKKGITEFDSGKYFVCYSYHASYEETMEILKFLKPKKILPNVVTTDTELEIQRNIEEFLRIESPVKNKPKLFKLKEDVVEEETPVVDNLDLSILDSPPRKLNKIL